MYAIGINKTDAMHIELGRGGHVKTVTIDGERFDVPRYTVLEPQHQLVINYGLRALSECYKRPSSVKQAIYDEWCAWARRNGAIAYGVASYNTMTFAFGAYLIDSHGEYVAYVHITRDNRRIYPFVSPLIESSAMWRV